MEVSAGAGIAAEGWIEHGVASVYDRCLPKLEGEVASYIPELANVDPDRFGNAVATVDGKLWTQGDAEEAFTIQSVSKAFSYCLALELLGREAVFKSVGVEPSGDAF